MDTRDRRQRRVEALIFRSHAAHLRFERTDFVNFRERTIDNVSALAKNRAEVP
jgi:hypothetical protein